MRTSDILCALDKRGIRYQIVKENNIEIVGFSSLFNYRSNTVTFIVPERSFETYIESFNDTSIACIIIGKQEKVYDCFENVVRVRDPRKAFFAVIEECFDTPNEPTVTGIASDPEIYGKYSFVSPGAVIGKNVKIGIGCVIEGDVEIGDDTEIHHNVVIRNKTKIGRRCTINSGVVIGEYGFGYTVNEKNEKTMLKHYGGIRIGDDVYLGENSIIKRGAIDDTVISRGVKINSHAIIAHNDFIGEDTIITSPVHVCGSVTIGKQCHIAGSTIRNQRTVGDNSLIGLGAVVVKNVPAHTIVVGNPAKKLEK